MTEEENGQNYKKQDSGCKRKRNKRTVDQVKDGRGSHLTFATAA